MMKAQLRAGPPHQTTAAADGAVLERVPGRRSAWWRTQGWGSGRFGPGGAVGLRGGLALPSASWEGEWLPGGERARSPTACGPAARGPCG